MKVLFLSQVYFPDVVATSQYVGNLARDLVNRGHEVTVLSSRRAYDQPETVYAARENLQGVEVQRVKGTGLGKKSLWRRAMDFGSVAAGYFWRLLFFPRQDLVIALCVPPMVSCLGAFFVSLRGGRLAIWMMDMNPDEAVAAGVLRADSLLARALEALHRYSLRKASLIIALDRFMRDRILAKGIDPERVYVAPPWTQDSSIAFDPKGREAFRKANGLDGRFVVMYSGNHSPCHPLTTILEAAERLAANRNIRFVFAGGGSEHKAVAAFARERKLDNIVCLPYQPFDQLSASLSAADLHLVVMGDPFLGLVHPSKVYNILQVGCPFLYVGPDPSHVTDLTPAEARGDWAFFARHGEVDKVEAHIRFCAERGFYRAPAQQEVRAQFAESVIAGPLIDELEEITESAQPAVASVLGASEQAEP